VVRQGWAPQSRARTIRTLPLVRRTGRTAMDTHAQLPCPVPAPFQSPGRQVARVAGNEPQTDVEE